MSQFNFSHINSFIDNSFFKSNENNNTNLNNSLKYSICEKTLNLKKKLTSFFVKIKSNNIKRSHIKLFLEYVNTELEQIESFNLDIKNDENSMENIDIIFFEENTHSVQYIKNLLSQIKLYIHDNYGNNSIINDEDNKSLIFTEQSNISYHNTSSFSVNNILKDEHNSEDNNNLLNDLILKKNSDVDKLLVIEEKYKFVNFVCDEINSIINTQTKFIKQLEKNFDSGKSNLK